MMTYQDLATKYCEVCKPHYCERGGLCLVPMFGKWLDEHHPMMKSTFHDIIKMWLRGD